MKTWNDIKIISDDLEHVKKIIYSKGDAVAESVLYRYPDYQTRTVICCSVQSGCPVGCRFCGSGDYFVRNLTTEEIVSQVEKSLELTEISPSDIQKLQVMFMSMGEPLLNLKNLLPAIEDLVDRYPQSQQLISTTAPDVGAGWFDLIEFSRRYQQVGLQFSIHESSDYRRNLLIPFKSKLTLQQIATKGTQFFTATFRKPFINYCAHAENSSEEDADRIYDLFDPMVFNATVSVVCERNEGLPSTNDFQRSLATDFSTKLVERGFDVRVFDPAGQDTIGGGCGQLWFVQDWMRKNPDKARPSCGHGKNIVHVPMKL